MRYVCLVLGALCFVAAPCGAAPRVVNRSVQLSTGLVIVPFAVPVAVPVAVVQDPAVVYGFRALTPVVPPQALPQGKGRPAVSLSNAGEGKREASSDRRDKLVDSPVAAILSRRCAECHTAGAAQGQFTLFQADGRLRDKLPRQWIVEVVTPGEHAPAHMPPASRAPLSPEELRELQAWAKPPKELEW